MNSVGIGIPRRRARQDHLGQVLQVDLVDNAGHGRDDAEVVEGLLAPLEELIALAVALEFDLGVAPQGIGRGEEIHLDRVVDDQVDGHERVDLARIAAQAGDGGAHGGQVHDGGDAGEVLHDDAGRKERNARADRRVGFQAGDVPDIVLP